jgi:hypothetical protein
MADFWGIASAACHTQKVAGDREVGDDTARPVAKFSMSVIAC